VEVGCIVDSQTRVEPEARLFGFRSHSVCAEAPNGNNIGDPKLFIRWRAKPFAQRSEPAVNNFAGRVEKERGSRHGVLRFCSALASARGGQVVHFAI
jgi:hypothetical protein